MKRAYYIVLLTTFMVSCSTPYRQLQAYIENAQERPEDFLFVLNGVILNDSTQSKLSELEAKDIAVVEKVSEPAAKAIYGAQAKPQTIIVNTKNY